MGPIWKILPLPTAVNPSSTIVCLQTRLPAKPGLVTLECGWLAPAFGSGTCPASDKLACHPAPEARRKTAASCLRKSGGKPPALQSGSRAGERRFIWSMAAEYRQESANPMNPTEDITSIGIACIKDQPGAEHGFDVKSLYAHLERQLRRAQNPSSSLKPQIPKHVAQPAA